MVLFWWVETNRTNVEDVVFFWWVGPIRIDIEGVVLFRRVEPIKTNRWRALINRKDGFARFLWICFFLVFGGINL